MSLGKPNLRIYVGSEILHRGPNITAFSQIVIGVDMDRKLEKNNFVLSTSRTRLCAAPDEQLPDHSATPFHKV